MLFLNHQLACRNCMQRDGMNHVYNLTKANQSEYQRKPEYELVRHIETWRAEDGHTCDFCGSDNIEVLEVDVDGVELYDFNRLVRKCEAENRLMFMLNIDKNNTSYSMNSGGNSNAHKQFLSSALSKIITTVSSRPDSTFKAHPMGNFFICLTSGPNKNATQSETTIQRFRYGGIPKKELLQVIKAFADRNKIIY